MYIIDVHLAATSGVPDHMHATLDSFLAVTAPHLQHGKCTLLPFWGQQMQAGPKPRISTTRWHNALGYVSLAAQSAGDGKRGAHLALQQGQG